VELSRRGLLYGAALVSGAAALPHAPGASAAEMTASAPPTLRLPVLDRGPVLLHGGAPGGADALGAREAIVFTDPLEPTRLLMHYDGAGPKGWLACLADSVDGGASWTTYGSVLSLGKSGSYDAASASSPWVVQDDDGRWHMYYLGARRATSAPRRIPVAPYTTLHATAPTSRGPWTKRGPALLPRKDTWYSQSVSPGPVRSYRGEWVMHFSGSGPLGATIGLARAASLDGPWTIDDTPVVSQSERLENAALRFDPVTGLWWMLANHISTSRGSDGLLFTDGIWGYWSTDPTRFTPAQRVLVLDATVCAWSRVIGMPSLAPMGGGLAVFYDGITGRSRTDHMDRDIGMAYLPLSLTLLG
jgi:hypothetical protein